MQIRSISAHRDAQSGLIGAPQPTSIEAVPAAPNGGSGSPRLLRSLIPGASIRCVRVRSYDRPDRSIVTVLLDTSM
jgi:hypothetical protein